jgi:CRISPR-associated protein Cas5d
MSGYPTLSVEVWGDFACFTRPELKTERVSYPTMTPSGARGVLEAIFWKPEAVWQVRRISTLAPVRWFNIRRNEVSDIPALEPIVRQAAGDADWRYDAETDRDQRATLGLRDVRYRIEADLVPKTKTDGDFAKYRDQFRRRVDRGQCFTQPFLGTREFTAFFGPATDCAPIPWDDHLGLMFWGFDYTTRPIRSGWFSARVDRGVLEIPDRPLPDSPPAGG